MPSFRTGYTAYHARVFYTRGAHTTWAVYGLNTDDARAQARRVSREHYPGDPISYVDVAEDRGKLLTRNPVTA